jgi:hypothetical protein
VNILRKGDIRHGDDDDDDDNDNDDNNNNNNNNIVHQNISDFLCRNYLKQGD